MKLLVLLAAAMLSAPAVARTTIVIDKANVCGNARFAEHVRQEREATGFRLAWQLRHEGREVRIVTIEPGEYVGPLDLRSGNSAPIFINSGC
jgi:hypothetical protein